jgi:hypothetical protein
MKHQCLYGVIFFCVFTVLSCGSTSKKDQMNFQDIGIHGDTLDIQPSDGDAKTDALQLEDLAEKEDLAVKKDMNVKPDILAEDVRPDTPVTDILKDVPEPQDESAADLTLPDTGIDLINPFPDMNGLDPLVAACLQFTADVCGKILQACQSIPLLGTLITDQTIMGCLNLLASGSEIVIQGCQMLTSQLPPEYAMLGGLAPGVLQACTANFQCTAEKLGKIIDAVAPLITGGGQLDAMQILDLIVALCL